MGEEVNPSGAIESEKIGEISSILFQLDVFGSVEVQEERRKIKRVGKMRIYLFVLIRCFLYIRFFKSDMSNDVI